MKYIRTTDERILEATDWNEDGSCWCLNDGGAYFRKEDIIAQADAIPLLCDEFCYIKDGIISQYLTINFKFKREDEFCSLSNKLTANGIAEIIKRISKYELQVGELKGAIWTSKGLEFVAKMNENGVLCLI